MNPAYFKIKTHIDACGGDYSRWYACITCDPRIRLFSQQLVCEHTGAWIHTHAGSEAAARLAEQALLALGCKGGPCGGDSSTCYVYAYRVTSTTVEAA